MKTIDDYMNDPVIADEPRALREIHAARFMIRDECKNMTASEFSVAAREDAIRISRKYGLPLVWSDLKPVTPSR